MIQIFDFLSCHSAKGADVISGVVYDPFAILRKASVITFFCSIKIGIHVRRPLIIAVEHRSAAAGQDSTPVPFLVMMYPCVTKGGHTFRHSANGAGFASGSGAGGSGGLAPAMISGGGDRLGFSLSAARTAPGLTALCTAGRSCRLLPSAPAMNMGRLGGLRLRWRWGCGFGFCGLRICRLFRLSRRRLSSRFR